MAKKSRTFGADPERLADLLSVGSDSDGSMPRASAEDEKAELLLDRLAEHLLLDPSFVKLLPDVPHLLSNAMELCGGDSVEDLILNKDVEIGLLTKVKDFNNRLSQRADSKAERDVAIAIYYAAIAGALVFHEQKITEFKYSNLEQAFKQLSDKSWMSADLKELFNKACAICRDPSNMHEDIS